MTPDLVPPKHKATTGSGKAMGDEARKMERRWEDKEGVMRRQWKGEERAMGNREP